MAGFGFAPSQVGGFGGGYLSSGIGAAMGNAASGGLQLANAFREYQNHNMLDQFQIPASEAAYNASMVNSEAQRLNSQAAYMGLLGLQNQPSSAYGVTPGGYQGAEDAPRPTAYYAPSIADPSAQSSYGLAQSPTGLPFSFQYQQQQYGYPQGSNATAAYATDALNYQPSTYYGGY